MEWIDIRLAKPECYDSLYAVAAKSECAKCDLLDIGISSDEHCHRMNYRRFRYDIASWSRAQPDLVKWYHDRGDHSWDHCLEDSFCETGLNDAEITHWFKLPAITKRAK